jgi:hypothetical protein
VGREPGGRVTNHPAFIGATGPEASRSTITWRAVISGIGYIRLVNDLAIYAIGLAKRDRTLVRLQATLNQYRQQPATFACTLVPRRAPGAPRVGCG